MIESNLKTLAENSTRIADALETLVSKMSHIGAAVKAELPAPAQPAAPATTPPAPPVAEQPAATPPAPPAPPAPVAPAQPAAPVMTPEELNKALVVEFQRLGGREAIDAAIRDFGATTITDLPAVQYQPLLAKVQAIPA